MTDTKEDIITGHTKPGRRGAVCLILFFVLFGGFAVFAKLATTTVATGVVSVDSSRKTIQHLEGGIIKEILARDGDQVEAGDVLIRLDRTQAAARADLMQARLNAARAELIRLQAERDGLETLDFTPITSIDTTSSNWQEITDGQRNVFSSRRQTLESQKVVLEQQISDFATQITGLEGQSASDTQQIALLDEEIKDVNELIAKGLARRPRLLALQRRRAEVLGQKSQYEADIARARQGMGETRLRIAELYSSFQTEVVERLSKVQEDIFDLTERARAARDVLRRTEVKAPLAGTVVNLRYFTSEGVIPPGDAIMDVVPSNDTLIIEAQLNPDDIDIVRPGLEARVRFTAINQRNTVPALGAVTEVSADRLVDERTGIPYFKARVVLKGDVSGSLGGAQLYPGMQAEVMIITGKTTLFDYLMGPVIQSIRKSLRT